MRRLAVLFLLLFIIVFPTAAVADGGAPNGLDTVWVLMAAFLVFLMQAGFAMVTAGFTRAKSAGNILMKNFMDFCVASLTYLFVGYAFMFGKGNGFIGLAGFGLSSGAEGTQPGNLPLMAFFIFQATFCGAAATIVAGAMAERMKFVAYLIYTVVLSALVYPIVGHWIWGGGWLATLNFHDFAGSTVVHACGGSAALIGAYILGPRIGRFGPDGKPSAMPGHSIPLATLGVFLLWFGWFGFNPGSALAVGDGMIISRVAVNTNLAAAAGGVAVMFLVWGIYGKPDLTMSLNGALAGLVAITAPCQVVSPMAAVVIGMLAGFVVVGGIALLDRLKVDDPVGAVPVHGMCGIFGTLAVGIWGQKSLGLANDGLLHGGGFGQLGIQALGAFSVTIFVVVVMGIVFMAIKKTIGLRVERNEELRGLDVGEHGMEAYSGFQIYTIQ